MMGNSCKKWKKLKEKNHTTHLRGQDWHFDRGAKKTTKSLITDGGKRWDPDFHLNPEENKNC